MKRLNLIITIVIVTILTYACSSTMFPNRTSALDVWLGHNSNELTQQLGPPDAVSDDGAGGQILTYGNSATVGDVNVDYRTKKSYTSVYVPPVTITRENSFYVNAQGIIYHTFWRIR